MGTTPRPLACWWSVGASTPWLWEQGPARGLQGWWSPGLRTVLAGPPAQPCLRGVCVHHWALAAVRGRHRPSISGVCESGQGGGSVQAGGALPPAHCRPLAPRRAEAARPSAAQGSGRDLSLGFTAITRLRRKGWPGAPQTASCLSSVLGGEEEGAGAGPWQWGRGAVSLQVSPFSPARGQGAPPKHSLAWLLGGDPGPKRRPQPRGGGVSGTGRVCPPDPPCRPGLRQRRGEQAGRAGPTDALSPSPRPDAGPQARWTLGWVLGGQEGPVRMWRGGEGGERR